MATRRRSNGAKSRSSFYRNREVICSTKLEDCKFFKECEIFEPDLSESNHDLSAELIESSTDENEEEEETSSRIAAAACPSDSDSDCNMRSESDEEDDFDYFSNFFGSKTVKIFSFIHFIKARGANDSADAPDFRAQLSGARF